MGDAIAQGWDSDRANYAASGGIDHGEHRAAVLPRRSCRLADYATASSRRYGEGTVVQRWMSSSWQASKTASASANVHGRSKTLLPRSTGCSPRASMSVVCSSADLTGG